MRTSLVLDLAKRNQGVQLGIWPRQGDVEGNVIEALVQRGGEDADLDGYEATFVVVRADGLLATVPCEVSGSTVTWGVTSAVTGAAGQARLAYLRLTRGEEVSTTENLTFEVMRAADATGEQAGEYETLVDRLAAQSASAAIGSAIAEQVPPAVSAAVAEKMESLPVSWSVGADGGLDVTVIEEGA